MKNKYPFITSISVLLRIIWYLQLAFGIVLILLAFSILADLNWFDTEKISGFGISFAKIDLGNVLMQDGKHHLVKLTHGEGRVHISDYKQNIVIYKIAGAIIELLVSIFVIYTLRKIFRNLQKGDFFIIENGLYLRQIAYAILGICLFLGVYVYLISSYILNNFSFESITLKRNIEFDTRTILTGLMVFVIAKIFIKGSEIKEEQDLTI